jgi:hypothetical protein
VIVGARVAGIGISKDDDGVTDGPGVYVISYLLEIGCSSDLVTSVGSEEEVRWGKYDKRSKGR